jgi:hypothetical protein
MVSSVPEPQVNIAQFLKKNLIARSKSNRGFGRDDRRCAWLLVGATRKRRTCECAICDSTETIYSANQTSQIAAWFKRESCPPLQDSLWPADSP